MITKTEEGKDWFIPMERGLHESSPATLGILQVDVCPTLDQQLRDVPPSHHGRYHQRCGPLWRQPIALLGLGVQYVLDMSQVTCAEGRGRGGVRG